MNYENDVYLTDVVLYAVHHQIENPPLLEGAGHLPTDKQLNAIASIEVAVDEIPEY